jgi:hypothetical protein
LKAAILKDLKHLLEKSNAPIAKLAYSMSMDVVEHHFEKYALPSNGENLKQMTKRILKSKEDTENFLRNAGIIKAPKQ